MAIELGTPEVGELDDVVGALRSWQREDGPVQLHPGDLAWHWRFGAEVLSAAARTWSRDGRLLAVGFLDSPDVLRMTVAPDAQCLLARNDQGAAVATMIAWSAGPGRPGLIEPLGVHTDHRRRGYASGICLAAAAHLREIGSSSVLVCTPTSLHSAVTTYEAAGFQRLPERLDRSRDT